MRTSGGRGTGVVLSALLPVLLVSALLVSGCAEQTDRARVVQAQLGRIDEVRNVDVATPSREQGGVIIVSFESGEVDGVSALTTLIADIDAVTAKNDYPPYRLELTPTGSDSTLVVDDTFTESAHEQSVLENWFVVQDALIGAQRYLVEPGLETITVNSAGGIAHDVAEAERIGYGTAQTAWTFVNAETSFTGSGSIGPGDVVLFQDVQRSVSSGSLPATAPGWQLERRDGHVRLDLDVELSGQSVPPEQLTVSRYGAAMAPLARAAINAVEAAGLPMLLGLHNADGTDDFGSWSSEQAPAKGRDPLDRRWDVWLMALARSTNASAGG